MSEAPELICAESDSLLQQFFYSIAAKTIFDISNDVIYIKDKNLKYVSCNSVCANACGLDHPDDIKGKTDFDIFEYNIAIEYTLNDRKIIESEKDSINCIEPYVNDYGKNGYYSTSKYVLKDRDGVVVGILGIAKDVSRDIAAKYHFQNELKYLFFHPEGVIRVFCVDVDTWQIVGRKCSSQCENCLDEIVDTSDLINIILSGIRYDDSLYEFFSSLSPEYVHEIYENGDTKLKFEYLREFKCGKYTGELHWVKEEIRFIINPDNGHLYMMFVAWDIDREKIEQYQISQEATYDSLTKIFNRSTCEKNISTILYESDKKCNHAFFIIDIDNFKRVNDTLGHLEGDRLLIAFAEGMKECIRDNDIVGRLGGDEFIIFLKNIRDKSVVVNKAEQLQKKLSEICRFYYEQRVSASIGISLYPQNGCSMNELYEHADRALYEAKGRGKNQVIFAP